MANVREVVRKRLGNYRLRRLRKRAPYPELWALAFGTSLPSGAHTADDETLDRPESVSVSHSGSKVVVSNTRARSIAVFSFVKRWFGPPKLRLHDLVVDRDLFNYAHGAVFGPADQSIIALGEYSHRMTAFDVAGRDREPAERVLWRLCGSDDGLEHPADLALHPSGRWLAVANRVAAGLSLYTIQDESNETPPSLSVRLSTPSLNTLGLAAPHGVAISNCGRFMFLTHKPYHKNLEDSGRSAVSVFACGAECPSVEQMQPIATYDYDHAQLHHIAVHPTSSLIAITNSQGDADLLGWDPETHTLEHRGAIDIYRVGEGAKGIAFTPSGEHVMITTELNEVLFFKAARYTKRRVPAQPRPAAGQRGAAVQP